VIHKEGSQKSVIDLMQTRDELYQRINYYQYESSLDSYLKEGDKK
jgi:methylisocitrate lyase